MNYFSNKVLQGSKKYLTNRCSFWESNRDNKHTLVRRYISLRMFVDRSNKGFPLNPPVSWADGCASAGGGLEIVVFDIIWAQQHFDKIISIVAHMDVITIKLARKLYLIMLINSTAKPTMERL
jgi:hypothetical protein